MSTTAGEWAMVASWSTFQDTSGQDIADRNTPALFLGPEGPDPVAIVLPVTGTSGNDTLFGTTTTGANNNDTISGLAGNDTIFGESTVPGTTGVGVDQIFAGDGNDSVDAGGGNDLIFGDAGSDTLLGGDGADVIRGGDGGDNLQGGNGDDVIVGESGEDFLFGGLGNDAIFGDDGNDVILGNDGNDVIDGGDGNETITGDLASAPGLGGNDIIVGGGGNDIVLVQEGADTVDGGEGNDTIGIFAGQNISIDGGTGDDVIIGGFDIFGASNATLIGGAGSDILVGGQFNDVFGYASGFGPADLIYLFTQGVDKIRLAANINNTGIATAADALTHASATTFSGFASTQVTLGNEIIILVGVPQLQAADFIIGS